MGLFDYILKIMDKIKLVLGVTVGGSSKLLEGQVRNLKDMDYDVYLMSPDHPKEIAFCKREGCIHIPIKINRNISLIQDLLTLLAIVKNFKKINPDIVNVGTPKMGLLGVIGAKIAGVKNRIYTCRGLRYETEGGLKRKILMFMEKMSARFATKVIYVSSSSMKKALQDKVAYKKKSVVLSLGSSNGINLKYFSKENINSIEKDELILKHNLFNQFTIGFIGRITKDKGIEDLIEAFEFLLPAKDNVCLILVGHFECSKELETYILNHNKIFWFPFTDNVPLFLSLFNVFVLPSYREGFPNVPIQAAAMGLPVITTNATGCIDSVKHGYNGFIYRKGNQNELKNCLFKYIESPELLEKHGTNSLDWAKNFENNIIWEAQNKLYKSMI